MAIFTFSSEHYDRLQEMVLKGSFGHILEGVMFLKWKLVNQRNKIYHKTYVLLGVQQNLSFQNQPQEYYNYIYYINCHYYLSKTVLWIVECFVKVALSSDCFDVLKITSNSL